MAQKVDKAVPSVTVVVPVYETEEYLPACLESILCQTFSNFEIIVVDDFSPGPCAAIVASYQENDGRLRYLRHTRNNGQLAACLTGVEKAQGKYTTFLDPDDTANRNWLERLLEILGSTNADIAGSAVFKVDHGREDQKDLLVIDGSQRIVAALCSKEISNHSYFTKLFRTNLFTDSYDLRRFSSQFRLRRAVDAVMCCSACRAARRFVQTSEVLVNYTWGRTGSATSDVSFPRVSRDVSDLHVTLVYLRSILCDDDFAKMAVSLTSFLYKTKIAKLSHSERRLILDQLAQDPAANAAICPAIDAATSTVLRLTKRRGVRMQEHIRRIRVLEASTRLVLSQAQEARKKVNERKSSQDRQIAKLERQLAEIRHALHKPSRPSGPDEFCDDAD